MTTPKESDTRDRLLNAAEKLFAESGVGATSLRAITAEAEANLASIHYHFGSKDALLVEVFSRRIKPVDDARLEQLKMATTGSPDQLEAVVRAFVAPALRYLDSPDAGIRAFTELMGRLYSEPLEIKFKILQMFEHVVSQFTAALGQCLPDLDRAEVFWRFHYMVGSMAFTITSMDMLKAKAGDHFDLGDTEDNIERLVRFIAGGFRAPGDTGSGNKENDGEN